MQKVTVAGGGVLGTQIAFQSAYKGKETTIWLRSPSSITRTQPKLDHFYQEYLADIEKAAVNQASIPVGLLEEDGSFDPQDAKAKARKAYESIRLELDLEKAVEGADIVIESMAEDPATKAEFYQKLAPVLDEDTILVTNSSTLLPSMFASLTGRPEKYMALHFANHIWRNNLTEVMVHEGTAPEVFEAVSEFAQSIGMDPVSVKKEKGGYLLNSMLVPFLMSAMDLLVTGTGSAEDIDKAWVKGTGAPYGPFVMLNAVGLETARNIAHQFAQIPDEIAPFHYKDIEKMLAEMIEKKETF